MKMKCEAAGRSRSAIAIARTQAASGRPPRRISRAIAAAAVIATVSCLSNSQAFAWGQEGHSVVAEIAQRRLTPAAADAVARLLGQGHSLTAIASWADDVRDARPESYNWHFVDMPIDRSAYDSARDCKPDAAKGDCIVAELTRLRNELRCESSQRQIEALKFAVHFVGDVHQPFHTVLEKKGGNGISVDLFTHGLTCTGRCKPRHLHMSLHRAWDSGLIDSTVWDWGAYVDRLETGWLAGPEARAPGIDEGTAEEWAKETHGVAQTVWKLEPSSGLLDDGYYASVLPILDRQLALAGLRLAHFLNEAYSSTQCPVQQ